MKFFVVPDSSERWTTTMSRSGSSAPSLSAAMAASFHLVMVPEKTLAMVSGVMLMWVSPVKPGTL